MVEIAVVTGATGMVGRRIVSSLLKQGVKVRILTRNKALIDPRLEIYYGDLQDPKTLEKLLVGASSLFHCAAELKKENEMWAVNVEGTQKLINVAERSNLKYICHMSSVGVIGKFKGIIADENTICSPINTYEITKLEAEKCVNNFNGNARVVILRPTNVIDNHNYKITSLNSRMLFLKGGENAHIVHAEDVAAAAIYFKNQSSMTSNNCFVVSYDDQKINKIAEIHAIRTGKKIQIHLPWYIPYILRRISQGKCNRGDVIYSSNKLLSTGFTFPLGIMLAIKDISENTKC